MNKLSEIRKDFGGQQAVSIETFKSPTIQTQGEYNFLKMSDSETTIFPLALSEDMSNDASNKEETESETTSDEDAEVLQLTNEVNELLYLNKWDSNRESLDEKTFDTDDEHADNIDLDDGEVDGFDNDLSLPRDQIVLLQSYETFYGQLVSRTQTSFQGLRLSNYQNDCYLNSAVNSIVTNPIIMKHIKAHSNHLETWMREVLVVHSPSSNLPCYASSDEIVSEWQMFLSCPIECITEHGGMECYEAIKEEYEKQVQSSNIVNEIQRLATEETSTKVKSVRELKSMLSQKFSYMECYSSESQEDASTPFFHVMQSIPEMEEMFRISGQKTRQCMECGKEEVRVDDTNISIYLDSNEDPINVSLQKKVEEWCNNLSSFEKKCDCTIFDDDQFVEDMFEKGNVDVQDEMMTNTNHREKFEVHDLPTILYIRKQKVKNGNPGVDISESIEVEGKKYLLKSALLYTGNGYFGHWRTLSREKDMEHYVLYNDASEPVVLKPNEELGYLQLCSDFIYVLDEGPPKKKPIEIDKSLKASKDSDLGQNNKSEAISSLEEAFTKIMDRSGTAQINIYV